MSGVRIEMAKVTWLSRLDTPKGKVLVTIESKEGVENLLVNPDEPFTISDGRQFAIKDNRLVALGGKG